MALIVEDGTGLATANSYISIAEATAYHSDRGNSAWAAASVPAQTAALINGSAFLDSRYRSSFKGRRKTSAQALEWPRFNAIDETGSSFPAVPDQIKQAIAEAALRALSGDLVPDLIRGGQIVEDQTGPLRTRWAEGAPALPDYPWITGILARVCKAFTGLRVTR